MERALKENPNLAKIGILFYQNINLIEEMIKEKKLEGTIENAANLVWAKGIVPLADMFAEKLGIPVPEG